MTATPAARGLAERDRLLTRVIPILLIAGVALSALVIAIGLALVAATGETGYGSAGTTVALSRDQAPASYPRSIGDIVAGAAAGRTRWSSSASCS